jgi:hypothetical protein
MILSRKHKKKDLLICSFLGLLFSCATAFAQGDLMIYPKRIVFDNTKKSQELSLSNNGTDTARYVISVMQVRMKDDGSFETITTPDSAQHFADQHFRFFPRTVVLAPREAQTVKIQLIRTNELQTGEYRSHIYFRSETRAKPLGEQENTNDKSISISIVPVFGISIPVIIKVGESSTQVNITKKILQMDKDTKPSLNLTINRIGNMSVYGDIAVEYISPSGKTTTVGLLKGIAIYSPTPVRRFKIPLDTTKNVAYQTGKLRITYSQQSSRPVIFTETELLLK